MSNPVLDMIHRQNEISRILRNPQQVYNEMMQNNPKFRTFVEENKGKSVSQIAAEHNIDTDILLKYMR